MAALLLSFGLMMTGCNSDGGSDSNTGGGGGNEITIVQTTEGIAADTSVTPAVAAQAAVFTVTVNKDLTGKVATFTNVADDDVVYKPATDETTKAAQAAAIAVLFGDGSGTPPAGAIYEVAYTANAESFTLTQKSGDEGPVAEAERPDVTVTDAPRDVTGSLTTVAADDGKYVKLLVEGGDFDPNAAVYFKKDGTEILITATATDAPTTTYTAAQGFTSGGAGKLISSAMVAVKASPTSGQLQQGDITLTLKADAYTGSVTAITAGFGVKVVVNDNSGTAYTVGNGTSSNTIKYTAGTPATVAYNHGGSNVTAQNLDPDFDGALIAVLSNLVDGDKVVFDTNTAGVIASAEFATAPTAAKITGAFGGTDELIISASTTPITTVTIPATKTLSAVAATLTTSGAATITVDGTLIVDKDGTDKVTITDAVITAGGAESALGAAASGAVTLGVNGSGIALRSGGTITTVGGAVLTIGATNTVVLSDATVTAGAANATFAAVAGSTAGTVTLGAGDTLVLDSTGGAITIAGTGKVVAGKTTIDGVGVWTASGADVTITSSVNGAALSGTGATLTATGASPKITQAEGAGNVLTIEAGVILDTTAASIVLKSDGTNAGKLVLAPLSGAAAAGGGAKLVINSSGTGEAVAQSGQTAANLTATGTGAAALTFTGTANTVITNIGTFGSAAAIKSLEAGTSANTDGTITLKGYSASDVTVSAAATFVLG
jgi:hypothetical protein